MFSESERLVSTIAGMPREDGVSTTGCDFVVVGGGTAGCILAARLSQDPAIRVALVEPGGDDRSLILRVPGGILKAMRNPRFDWCLQTVPQAGLEGRVLPIRAAG